MPSRLFHFDLLLLQNLSFFKNKQLAENIVRKDNNNLSDDFRHILIAVHNIDQQYHCPMSNP